MSLEEVVGNLNVEIKKIEGRTMKGLIRAAIPVRRDAVKAAPIVTGNLRASVFTITSKGRTQAGSNPNFKGKEADKMAEHHQSILSEEKSIVGGAKRDTVEIGFSAVYALKVHENRYAGKTGMPGASKKGGWKFLENALKNNQALILKRIQEEARIK